MRNIKIIISSFILLLIIIGCDMNKRPPGVIDPVNALTTYGDAIKLKDGIYVKLRTLASGLMIYSTEVQADLFHASVNFSNQGGDLYRWELVSSSDYAENIWSWSYNTIAHVNYLIQGIPEMNKSEMEIDEIAGLEVIIGEAYFARAYAYYLLVDKFCQAYTVVNPEEALGVPTVTIYNPTSNSAEYPSRATIAETYALIVDDLRIAAEKIESSGSAGSNYITKDAVKAMKARVALMMGNWDEAIKNSEEVISTNKYGLISTKDAFADMWLNDKNTECIIQYPASKPNEVSDSWSLSFNYLSYERGSSEYNSNFIPEQWVLDLYTSTEDIRRDVYFKEVTINYPSSTETLFACNKFPGNPSLYTGNSNYVNKIKPFRVAELYLIAAEAYAQKGGNDAQASKLLNDLRAKRILNWTTLNYAGTALIQEIRDERVKELFGEGFRFSDLKRYNEGMTRRVAQSSTAIYLPNSSTTEFLTVIASDSRFLWPIPQHEIDANPQIKGQQNPGY